MFFKKKVVLSTILEAEQIISRLKKFTIRKYSINSDPKDYFFEGRFEDRFFVIFPILDYDSNYLLRPEIRGTIENDEKEGRIIVLNFILPIEMKIIFILAIVVSIWKITDAVITKDYNQSIIAPLFLFVTFAIFYGIFKYNASRSSDIIIRALNAKKI